jgi:hypothetical protein
LLHLAEELPGIGGEALDVAALAFGIDGVEGEARLAAARQPGDHDEAIPREVEGDVLQVVFASTANDDPILGHTPSVPEANKTEQVFA